MTISKKQLEEAVQRAHHQAFAHGRITGRDEAKAELQAQFADARLQQMKAAVHLLEEAGRLMSRAGYMIGKINNDNAR